jgi:hypothetical protein
MTTKHDKLAGILAGILTGILAAMGHKTLEMQAGSQTVWLVRCDPVWLVRGARQVPTGVKHGKKSGKLRILQHSPHSELGESWF